MKKYEYIEEVKNCIIDYIKENYDEGAEIHTDILYDELFIADSVTGNASGSYYCNSYKAYEALGYEVGELVEELEAEFGEIPTSKRYDWEFLDVSMRCLVLYEALNEAREELEEKYEF